MTASVKGELSGGEGTAAFFERLFLPHLNAAYNLARWLTHDDQNAEDLVQEAYLRAWKSLNGFAGGDGRSWLLSIVRNTCYTWLQRDRPSRVDAAFNEEIHSGESDGSSPETALLQSLDRQLLKQALEELPLEFREVLIMRELEGLSYKEIADVADIPVGTVMSRLARARQRLQRRIASRGDKGQF
jgi:RNA polymerase sigma-70 factor (ECF subfamily)